MATQAQRIFDADPARWDAAKARTIELRAELDRKFAYEDVLQNKWLALVAEHYAATYAGDFEYMVSMRETARALSYRQVAGVLNCAIADWSRGDRFTNHPTEQYTLPNVADVPNSRYRVVAADGSSLSVRLDNATWATNVPENTRALYYLGRGADWQFAGFVTPGGMVKLSNRERAMAPRLKAVLGDLSGSVREGRWLVHALAYSMEGSECCFCGRALDTAESISVGYGPKCAANNGLPWGDRAEPASVVLARDAAAGAEDGGITPPSDAHELDDDRALPNEPHDLLDPAVVAGDPIGEPVEPAFKGHAYGVFESGRQILEKSSEKLSVFEQATGRAPRADAWRPGRSYEDIFGDS